MTVMMTVEDTITEIGDDVWRGWMTCHDCYDLSISFGRSLDMAIWIEDLRGSDHEILTVRHDDIWGRHTRLTKSTRKARNELRNR